MFLDINITKNKIIYEAAILFAERGYYNVGMREISSKLSIKESSIYHYFASKEKLFKYVLSELNCYFINNSLSEETIIRYARNLDFEKGVTLINESFNLDFVKMIYFKILFREQYSHENVRIILYENIQNNWKNRFILYFEELNKKKKIKDSSYEYIAHIWISSLLFSFLTICVNGKNNNVHNKDLNIFISTFLSN